MSIKHVVSVSGGKDSAATLLLAIERFGRRNLEPIFCDTGNEHDEVYAYLNYLEGALGIKIHRLRANFDAEIAAKRLFIARDKRTRREYEMRPVFEADGITPVSKRDNRGAILLDKKGMPIQKTVKIGGGQRVRWSNKSKRRALALLHPTGNPFLDLCMWKGRFPSRKAQFCTQELKVGPAVEFQLTLMEAAHTVVSWQGIRRDESQNRRNAKKFESLGGGLYHFRPLVEWTAAQVFEYCASKGIKPNPLYLQGMAVWAACPASTPTRPNCARSPTVSLSTSRASMNGSSWWQASANAALRHSSPRQASRRLRPWTTAFMQSSTGHAPHAAASSATCWPAWRT
jgi:3'-phosphoadenosine 5'-phosphosulfate sulfotransferase (PAPS reductase)/FAD synthetase